MPAGTTVAVIGGGHAVGVPGGHRRLARAILDAGGAVVSEHAPDVEPTHGTFPRRNRIISGLADASIVVEAPARSGALLTASWALEQGRHCFLVPGPLDATRVRRLPRVPARVPGRRPDRRRDPAAHRGPRVRGASARDGRSAPADGLVGASLQDLGRTGAAGGAGAAGRRGDGRRTRRRRPTCRSRPCSPPWPCWRVAASSPVSTVAIVRRVRCWRTGHPEAALRSHPGPPRLPASDGRVLP